MNEPETQERSHEEHEDDAARRHAQTRRLRACSCSSWPSCFCRFCCPWLPVLCSAQVTFDRILRGVRGAAELADVFGRR